MTLALLDEFRDHRRQVRHYLAVVLASERAAKSEPMKLTRERRLLTLRAGSFLILYNLIEASARAAIDAIHDEILTDQTPFDRLIPSIRKESVKRFKKYAKEENHEDLLPSFPSAFIAVALNESFKFSGNVDARLIRKLSDVYGFSCESPRDTWGGVDLLSVKTIRNDLGHGRKSFEEVGRDYPATELLLISRRSINFMDSILNNVSIYLENKSYIDT